MNGATPTTRDTQIQREKDREDGEQKTRAGIPLPTVQGIYTQQLTTSYRRKPNQEVNNRGAKNISQRREGTIVFQRRVRLRRGKNEHGKLGYSTGPVSRSRNATSKREQRSEEGKNDGRRVWGSPGDNPGNDAKSGDSS